MKKNNSLALSIQNLTFNYPQKQVLNIPRLEIPMGEHTLISGESGCGKSTLLNLVSGILTGHNGTLQVLGRDYAGMKAAEYDRFRAENIAVVFQQFNLISYLSARENILLGVKLARKEISPLDVDALLRHLQVDAVAETRAGNLSHGQQQRIAVARALAQKAPLILADEPTSALDEKNARLFWDLLFNEARANNTTIVVVSHDVRHQKRFDRVIDFTKINDAVEVRKKNMPQKRSK
ncbi:MAG TPA: ATP-binding cassette domain-containing protein [Turneriella sp.]|nr:ATP-binding cassette domain-containing protein [Turneriella sp.]